MGLDIRYPIGFLFSLIGILLTIFGLSTSGDTEMYAKALDININLWTGVGMLIFGGLMVIAAYSKTLKKRAAKKQDQ